MIKFGLISEGLTDHIVIEDILSGYLGDDHIRVYYLQPIDNNEFGNWLNVLNYCQSSRFKQAFQSNDYIIIQIDTDVSEEQGYDIPKSDENGNILSPEEIIQKVKKKLILLIGSDFYQANSNRIIFAISVHSIECWLLPLYYQDKRKAEIKNCTSKLAQAVKKTEKFYLDPKNKDTRIYGRISCQYCKKKTLLKHYPENPSFKIFVEDLQSRNISIND